MSLQKLERDREFEKIAMEGDQAKNIEGLISQQAYESITEKFKDLSPLILGFNIVDKISDQTILAAAKLAIPGKSIIIPVLYSGGVVDATTFIFNEDTDVLLGMTKKIIRIITTDSGSIDGTAIAPGSIKGQVDHGSIDRLFIPPKTFSPKIGSSGLLLRMMETSNLLKEAVYTKMVNDPDYKETLVSAYGKSFFDNAKSGASSMIEKRASLDHSKHTVLWSRKEIFDSGWINKEAAIAEYSVNGYAVSQGKDAPTLSLKRVQNNTERILEQTGGNEITSFGERDVGFFKLFDYSGKSMNIVAGPEVSTGFGLDSPSDLIASPQSFRVDEDEKYASIQITLEDMPELKPFTIGAFSKESSNRDNQGFLKSRMKQSRMGIVLLKKDQVYMAIGDSGIHRDRIIDTLGTYVIEASYGSPKIVIEKKSSACAYQENGVYYVGEKKVRVIKSDRKLKFSPVTMSGLSKTASDKDMTTVSFDGAEYLYKQSMYSKKGIVGELLDEGYDKHSVYDIVKLAKESGGASLESVNAKIEMLTNMIMNLAGTKAEGMASAPVAEEAPPPAIEPAPAPMQEMPSQGQAQAIPASPNAGMSDPAAGMAPMEEELAQPVELTPEGMNPSVDATTVQMLSELKDTSVMDMGVLSTLAVDTDLGEVISSYRDDVQTGVSAIARILINILTKQDEIKPKIGDAKYKQLVNTLRPILIKMSDAYADIYYLKLESGI